MADLVFQFGRHFRKRLFESGRLKDWIVTETTASARWIDNVSFDNAFERPEHFSVLRQSNHAPEMGRSFFSGDVSRS